MPNNTEDITTYVVPDSTWEDEDWGSGSEYDDWSDNDCDGSNDNLSQSAIFEPPEAPPDYKYHLICKAIFENNLWPLQNVLITLRTPFTQENVPNTLIEVLEALIDLNIFPINGYISGDTVETLMVFFSQALSLEDDHDIKEQCLDIITMLISKNADVNIGSTRLKYPLFWALNSDSFEAVEMIVNAGADLTLCYDYFGSDMAKEATIVSHLEQLNYSPERDVLLNIFNTGTIKSQLHLDEGVFKHTIQPTPFDNNNDGVLPAGIAEEFGFDTELL